MDTFIIALREALAYNPDTGVFTWRVRPNGRITVGDVAGNPRTDGYTQIRFQRQLYLTHQLAWAYVHGKFPEKGLDHIDRDKANNRINNLRPATQLENMQNKGMYCNNSSGYTGVNWNNRSKKWTANIRISGDLIHIGTYVRMEDAIEARRLAKAQHHLFNPGMVHV